MIRAVLFDLDGTLLPLDFDRFFAAYFGELCRFYQEAIGLDVRAVSIKSGELMLRNDGQRTNADLFWSHAAADLGQDRATLERLYGEFVVAREEHLRAGVTADPGAVTAVEGCRRKGARVVLATNPVFPRVLIDARIRWAGLDPAGFELVTYAEGMHSCKPRPEYFRETAALLPVAPADCLMVGNDADLDLVPAAQVGMRTCLVDSVHARARDGYAPDHRCPLAEVPALLAA